MIDFKDLLDEFKIEVEKEKIRVSREFLERVSEASYPEEHDDKNLFTEVRALNRALAIFEEIISRR